MNYYNQKCPHCKKVFTKDDDIVVCPICGTPQHRECYEEDNKCVNFSKHTQSYVWKEEEPVFSSYYQSPTGDFSQTDFETNTYNDSNTDEGTPKFIICKNCGTPNTNDSIFCKHCSVPLSNHIGRFKPNAQSNFGSAPDNNQEAFSFAELFSINENDKIAEDITIGEANKFIKDNTTTYDLVFKRIFKLNKSRFNFAAFAFSGVWFLYRKQYLIGTILTILLAISLVGYSVFCVPSYNIYESIAVSTTSSDEIYNTITSLPLQQQLIFVAPSLFRFLQYAIMLISGFIGNRCYYNYVTQSVRKAKNNSNITLEKAFEKNGGVDRALGYILFIGYIIMLFLPNTLLGA